MGGVEWYSFRKNAEDGQHLCTHSESCKQFSKGAKNQWQRFNAAPALWSQVGDDYSKCKDKPTQKTSAQIFVANQDECQANAVSAGVEWYSFRKNAEDGQHLCTHSESCKQFSKGAKKSVATIQCRTTTL